MAEYQLNDLERTIPVFQDPALIPFRKDDKLRPSEAVDVVIGSDGDFQGNEYALKTFKLHPSDKTILALDKRKFLVELKLLNHARHHHVIALVYSYFLEAGESTHAGVVMPLAEPFKAYLEGASRTKKQLAQLQRWFGCLASVVDYIHGIGIRHRDIKPDNILVKGDNVFLADFGISKMGLGKTLSTTRPEDPRGRTLQYCAPEVEDGRSRGRSADIFSLGAVFLEMLVAHSYFNRRQELSDALGGEGDQNRSYTYAEHLADVQKWMNSLLKDTMQDYESGDWRPQVLSLCLRMLHEDRDDRPHAYEVLDSILSIPSAAVHPCDECASQPETNDAKLLYFCRRGSLPGVNDLITRHEDLKDTVGAIHQASTHGHLSIVEALLDAGFNVNLQDYSGQTALHCAAGYEREKVVDCLIRNGGKAAIPDGEGRTALHYAAGHGSVIIATKLRSAWSDGPRATDIHGQTPLHFAAGRGHKEVVLKLLDWGATKNEHVDFADTKRRTALHFAAGYGSEEVVKLLLERGAHVKKETEKSWTALHFAAKGVRREGQYVGVIKMLLEEKPNSDLWADLIYDKTNGCKYPERLELLKEAFRKM